MCGRCSNKPGSQHESAPEAQIGAVGAAAGGSLARRRSPWQPRSAGPAYVSDELVLGVYAEQNNQGQRLATLHSGNSVEALAESGEFTQVRLSDGTTGWVKSAYLTTKEPAIVRVKQLEEELDRSRATTPALAEAAARKEVERLTRELEQARADLAAARDATSPAISPAAAGPQADSGPHPAALWDP